MPDSFLSRCRRMADLEKKATPGDWEVNDHSTDEQCLYIENQHEGIATVFTGNLGYVEEQANAAFIAAARNIMPDLLAKLEQQRKALEDQPCRCKCLTHGFGCGIEEATCRKDLKYVCSRCAALADSVEEPKT